MSSVRRIRTFSFDEMPSKEQVDSQITSYIPGDESTTGTCV